MVTRIQIDRMHILEAKNTISGRQFRSISQNRPFTGTGFQVFTLFSASFSEKCCPQMENAPFETFVNRQIVPSGNLDTPFSELLGSFFGTGFAAEFRLSVVQSVIMFGFDKPIASAVFLATIEALVVVFDFPEWIL